MTGNQQVFSDMLPTDWGNWKLRTTNWTLMHTSRYPDSEARTNYEIDLEKIHTPAAIVDWIFHLVRGKVWMTDQDSINLIEAFRSIFGSNSAFRDGNQKFDASRYLRERYQHTA